MCADILCGNYMFEGCTADEGENFVLRSSYARLRLAFSTFRLQTEFTGHFNPKHIEQYIVKRERLNITP